MAGATIDHLISVTVFLGAILLFISLFNQTIQTAIVYQRHRNLATRCSDLLDSMLLSPGYPLKWGRMNGTPTSFGLQDPEFTQYRLSPFSLMRLNYTPGEPVYYEKTGQWYSNITMGFGQSLFVPYNQVMNYSYATKLLGINNTYGFSLSMTPIVAVTINEVQVDPLNLSVNVYGSGFPLAGANVSYSFVTVQATGGEGAYPSYTIDYGTALTNDEGSVYLSFPSFDATEESYALLAYAHLNGLVGAGYHERVQYQGSYVVPIVSDFETGEVLIAHSYDVHEGDDPAEISYNATFMLLSEDFTLREMPLENSTGKLGKINYGYGKPYQNITLSTDNPGLLIITYRKSAQESGIVVMPWGISPPYPVSFGDNISGREWIATDTRQVVVNGMTYQAKLGLWSLEGYQVIG